MTDTSLAQMKIPMGRLSCRTHGRWVVQGNDVRACPECGYRPVMLDLLDLLTEAEIALANGWETEGDRDGLVAAIRDAIKKARGE